jgi:hypothetical protein
MALNLPRNSTTWKYLAWHGRGFFLQSPSPTPEVHIFSMHSHENKGIDLACMRVNMFCISRATDMSECTHRTQWKISLLHGVPPPRGHIPWCLLPHRINQPMWPYLLEFTPSLCTLPLPSPPPGSLPHCGGLIESFWPCCTFTGWLISQQIVDVWGTLPETHNMQM